MINVRVNAEPRTLPPETTLAELIATLVGRPDPPGTAAALNGRVVPRARWAETRLNEGDCSWSWSGRSREAER